LKSKDSVTGQEHNAILVIIDKLTKWGYFIAYIEEISVENVTQIYVKKVFSQYRSLKKIILDKDLRFVATFWEIFLTEQRVCTAILMAYHPQTNGQTKKLNQMLKQYL